VKTSKEKLVPFTKIKLNGAKLVALEHLLFGISGINPIWWNSFIDNVARILEYIHIFFAD
jgi:hypothetical protein